MELMRGYKQTDAGVIPNDWESSCVENEFHVQLGKMLDSEKNVGVYKPYLGNKAVQWGRIDTSGLSAMRMTPTDIAKFRLEIGDLLVCEGGEVGRAAIWNAPIPECYYQKALHRLRPKNDFNSRFMLALLEQYASQGRLANYVTQTSIAHLPRDKFLLVPIPRPSADEQRAIATALSDVDALLDGLDRLIAKKRDIKQAAMQQLLTGKTRLPGFEGEWNQKKLGELGSTYGGLTGKKKSDFGEGEAQYVTFLSVVSNAVIDAGEFEHVDVAASESQNLVKAGDLLFNGSSETPEEVALCALVATETPRLYLNSFCFGFRLFDEEKGDGLFLSYYIRGNQGRELMKSLAQGSTRYNLSKKALMDALVLLPDKEEQVAIRTVIQDMDAEIEALENRRAKTADLKQAMMQELLTGRIRLI